MQLKCQSINEKIHHQLEAALYIISSTICTLFRKNRFEINFFVQRNASKFAIFIDNGAELGGATGAMAPLVFWSRSIKKSRNQSLVVLRGTSCFCLRSAPMVIHYIMVKLKLGYS